MAQSLVQLFSHLVFHKKSYSPPIQDRDKHRLYNYIVAIVERHNCKVLAINGISDHVHILMRLSSSVDLSRLISDIKRESSRWLKTLSTHYSKFYWQGGYGIFSVSPRDLDALNRYVQKQEIHHRHISTRDEMQLICDRSACEYDPRYLLSD